MNFRKMSSRSDPPKGRHVSDTKMLRGESSLNNGLNGSNSNDEYVSKTVPKGETGGHPVRR